jgi:hypothetical protein
MAAHTSIFRIEDGIRYERLERHHLAEAIPCLCTEFSAREPMTRALALSVADLEPLVTLVCQQAVCDGLSIAAVEAASHVLVGCLIAHDFATPLAEGLEAMVGRLAPILALLDTLEARFLEGRTLVPRTYLHVFMAVSRVPQRGIYTTLRHEVQRQAKALGFQWVVGEPTGPISQHVLVQKFGHQVAAEVPYADFEFQGVRVFQAITTPRACLLTVGAL